jgi:hypothetical protein
VFIYWVLFAYFAAGTMLSPKDEQHSTRRTPLLLFGACLTAVLIGFRYKVGGDWDTYQLLFNPLPGSRHVPPVEDLGYQAVNWIVRQLQLDVWGVNVICGAIFTWGLFRFCIVQSDPWLSALIAIPYMVIVVAMGYTRQSVALGILMAGLGSVIRGASTVRFSVYTAIAALFHRTAVVALPIMAVSGQRNRVANALIAIAGGVLLYDVFLGNAMDAFVRNYIHAGYSSSGAGVRVAMNFFAAAILATANHRLEFSETEWKLWRGFAWASLILLALLFMSPSSTAVDRISIYLMPLQIAVLSRVPRLLNPPALGRLLVLLYLAAVQFVWLNFAQFSSYWVPYRFFPL